MLNDGSPTRMLKAENGAGVKVHDIMFIYVAINNKFTWEGINDRSSNHLPIFIKGSLDAKVERDYRAGQKN